MPGQFSRCALTPPTTFAPLGVSSTRHVSSWALATKGKAIAARENVNDCKARIGVVLPGRRLTIALSFRKAFGSEVLAREGFLDDELCRRCVRALCQTRLEH